MNAELTAAKKEFDDLTRTLLATAGPGAFNAKIAELERLKLEHEGLPERRRLAHQKLHQERYQQQLVAFLDRSRIGSATIQGIGDLRKATLASYGVETAADIDKSRIMMIPGFGPALATRLHDWRKSIERNFVFDPSRMVDPALTRKVDVHIMTRK